MLAFYVTSLAASASCVGLFVHHLIAGQGYMVGFRLGAIMVMAAAFGYCALQLFYMAGLQVIRPTKSRSPLFFEILSHAAALLLLPYIVGVRVHWPQPLDKVEPLIYLGAFGLLHVFFKLISFFAALQSAPAGRLGALGWLCAAGMAGLAAAGTGAKCMQTVQKLRPIVTAAPSPCQVGGSRVLARPIPENASLVFPLTQYAGRCLTMRWGHMPDAEDEKPLDRIYVTVTIEGGEPFARPVDLRRWEWTELTVPAEVIPRGARSCSITWAAEKRAGMRMLAGLRAAAAAHREALLSGPFEGEYRFTETPNDIIILVADGLGSVQVAGLGGKRGMTPNLERLAENSVAFPDAYTPAPEAMATTMSILTGLSPLRHGYLGTRHGPLPKQYKTLAQIAQEQHYVTAALTDDDPVNSIETNQGAELGFQYSENTKAWEEVSPQIAVGSEYTEPAQRSVLDRARVWLVANRGQKLMLWVRITDWRAALPPAKSVAGEGAPNKDIQDASRSQLDRELGAFIKQLRATEDGKSACIILTSSFGSDAAGGATERLSENVLRIPILLNLPGREKALRKEWVGLQDIAPTLASLAKLKFPAPIEGQDLLSAVKTTARAPVSMLGTPLVLSTRNEKWRLCWESGRMPFSPQVADGKTTGQENSVELHALPPSARGDDAKKTALRNPETVKTLRQQLETCLAEYSRAWLQ